MTPRQQETALWVGCIAAAVVFGMTAPHIGPITGLALGTSVMLGRQAARHQERRHAAAQVHHHHAAALRSAAQGMEDAALQHGSHGIYTTLTYAQAADILRDTADQRDKDQPA